MADAPDRRLVQQEGGALTRPAALAAEQLLDSGAVEASNPKAYKAQALMQLET